MSDERNQPSQPAFAQAGLGLQAVRSCLGCQKPKSLIGSQGVGVRWRCIDCLAARRARAESQPIVKEEA